MRQRTISDSFWRDPDIADLSHEDKGTLLYFLTSPSSNIIGCYRIVWMQAAAEMGWTKDQLMVVAKRLRVRDLIDFNEAGWVWIKVWWEHNSCKGAFAGSLAENAALQYSRVPDKWKPLIYDWMSKTGAKIEILQSVTSNTLPLTPVSTPPSTPATGSATGSVSQYTIPNIQYTTTTTTETGNQQSQTVVVDDLIFSPNLLDAQKTTIAEMLSESALPVQQQQVLLDELHGAQLARDIPNPVGYTRALIERIKNNTFKPELAEAVAHQRTQQAAIANHLANLDRQSHEQQGDPLQKLPLNLRDKLARMHPGR